MTLVLLAWLFGALPPAQPPVAPENPDDWSCFDNGKTITCTKYVR